MARGNTFHAVENTYITLQNIYMLKIHTYTYAAWWHAAVHGVAKSQTQLSDWPKVRGNTIILEVETPTMVLQAPHNIDF